MNDIILVFKKSSFFHFFGSSNLKQSVESLQLNQIMFVSTMLLRFQKKKINKMAYTLTVSKAETKGELGSISIQLVTLQIARTAAMLQTAVTLKLTPRAIGRLFFGSRVSSTLKAITSNPAYAEEKIFGSCYT